MTKYEEEMELYEWVVEMVRFNAHWPTEKMGLFVQGVLHDYHAAGKFPTWCKPWNDRKKGNHTTQIGGV